MSDQLYLLALGSNRLHARIGRPRAVVSQAFVTLSELGQLTPSPIVLSAPIGPSQRIYANAAALLSTPLAPPQLLAALQQIEANFGRERRGQRWRARVLDLDIILWSGGIWVSRDLVIPHPQFRQRDFVLGPASTIAPDWRDPVTGLSVRQLNARLTKAKPLPR